MSWDDESPTEYLGPGGWDVEVPNGKVIRMSKTHAEIAENEHGAKVLGPSSYEPPMIPYEPGLPALLYAHGAVQRAEEMHRKLVASGGTVPKGGFPSRCTTTDERGVRCYLGYAHAGEHYFGNDAGWNPRPDQAYESDYFRKQAMPDQQPRTRIISDDTALKFLNEKIENIHEQIQFIDNQLAEHEEKKAAMQRTRAQLRHDENQLHEAIATLTGVRAKKLGEGHGGSR